MEFDLTLLRKTGKTETDFAEKLPLPEDLTDLNGFRIAEDPAVNGHLSVLSDGCYVTCTVTYQLVGPCARCLSETVQTFTCEVEEKFTPQKSEDSYSYSSNRLILDRAVCDAILTSLPLRLLCREDCKGLCPVCGANRNETDCGHEPEQENE